jgi:type IV pilus assembly protein PilO
MKLNSDVIKQAFERELHTLKTFDWNNLKEENKANVPVVVKAVLFLAIFAGTLFFADRFVISSASDGLNGAEIREGTLLTELEGLNYAIPTEVDYKEQLVVLSQMLEDIQDKLPEDIDMARILKQMDSIAIDSGIVITNISVNDEVDAENYIQLPFAITAKGKYHNIAGFIEQLSRIDRIVTIGDFTMRPENGHLEVEIMAKTYRYKNTETSNEE